MADLEHHFQAQFSRGQEAWPEITAPESRFRSHFEKHWRAADQATAESRFFAEDLYLACACAAACSRAIAKLESTYFGYLVTALAKYKIDSDGLDEIKQQLFQKLFVCQDGEEPKIAKYNGRTPLKAWLKVVATRLVIDHWRKHQKREVLVDDNERLVEALTTTNNSEMQYIKNLYRQQFKEAFQKAVRSLTVRDTAVLYYQILDGLNIDQIGAIFGVHRATVARWSTKIRETLLQQTRQQLMTDIQVAEDEVESIIRLIESQLEVSLDRLLQEQADDPNGRPPGSSCPHNRPKNG